MICTNMPFVIVYFSLQITTTTLPKQKVSQVCAVLCACVCMKGGADHASVYCVCVEGVCVVCEDHASVCVCVVCMRGLFFFSLQVTTITQPHSQVIQVSDVCVLCVIVHPCVCVCLGGGRPCTCVVCVGAVCTSVVWVCVVLASVVCV